MIIIIHAHMIIIVIIHAYMIIIVIIHAHIVIINAQSSINNYT